MPALEIDTGLLLEALTRPPELAAHLDLDSGEVILGPASEEDETETERENVVEIPRVESRAEYDRMARFAEGVDEDDVRERLVVALDGRGAFARFRHVLGGYPDLRAEWERQRRQWLLAEARAWLEEVGIDAVLRDDVPVDAPEPPPRGTGRRPLRIGLLDLLLLGAPDGKTELLEGKVYRVFRGASPGEARAVFKSVARDLCEFHGTAWRNRFIEGRDTYSIDRASLRIEGDHVELAIDVDRELWRMFER